MKFDFVIINWTWQWHSVCMLKIILERKDKTLKITTDFQWEWPIKKSFLRMDKETESKSEKQKAVKLQKSKWQSSVFEGIKISSRFGWLISEFQSETSSYSCIRCFMGGTQCKNYLRSPDKHRIEIRRAKETGEGQRPQANYVSYGIEGFMMMICGGFLYLLRKRKYCLE